MQVHYLIKNVLQDYVFVVTAKDSADDPRIATATVSVEVTDVEDELPIFRVPEYTATVPENMPDFLVTEVQVSVSDSIKINYVFNKDIIILLIFVHILFYVNFNTISVE